MLTLPMVTMSKSAQFRRECQSSGDGKERKEQKNESETEEQSRSEWREPWVQEDRNKTMATTSYTRQGGESGMTMKGGLSAAPLEGWHGHRHSTSPRGIAKETGRTRPARHSPSSFCVRKDEERREDLSVFSREKE